MKKNVFKRALCLACCLSLTLGFFVYKPPKADAYFGVASSALGGAIIGTIVRATTAYYSAVDASQNDFLNSIGRLVDNFISDNSDTISETTESFAGVIGGGVTRRSDGLIQFSSAAGRYVAQFLNWLQNDKLTVASPSYTYTGKRLLPLAAQSGGGYISSAYCEPLWDEDGNNATYRVSNINVTDEWFPILDASSDPIYVTNGDRAYPLGVRQNERYYNSTGRVDLLYNAGHAEYTPGTRFSADVKYDAFQICVFGKDYLGYVLRTTTGALDGYIIRERTLGSILGASEFTGSSVSVTALDSYQTVPLDIDTTQAVVLSPNIDDFNLDNATLATSALVSSLMAGTVVPTVSVDVAQDVPGVDTGTDIVVPGADAELLDWTKYIAQNLAAIPQAIADAIAAIFVPDANLINDITGAFNAKFGFVETLKTVGDDLLGMTADTEPPAVWLHLEDAEGNVRYGDAVLALDLTWYSRYKADVDRILGGFLWLCYLWLLFKRAPNILAGMGLTEAPPARSSDDGR